MNPESVMKFVDDYRVKAGKKLSNPYVFGLIALILAYRGKMGTISRTLLGVAGAVTLYQNYLEVSKKSETDSALDMITQYAKGMMEKDANTASGGINPALWSGGSVKESPLDSAYPMKDGDLELADGTDFPSSEDVANA